MQPRLTGFWRWVGRPPERDGAPTDLGRRVKRERVVLARCGRSAPSAVAPERHPCAPVCNWPPEFSPAGTLRLHIDAGWPGESLRGVVSPYCGLPVRSPAPAHKALSASPARAI